MKMHFSRLSWAVVLSSACVAGWSTGTTESIGSCGHSHRMELAHRIGALPNLSKPAVFELTNETDVLNNALNLTILPPSNSISGTNVITAKSLIPSLTEFTFRLNNTFTLGTVTLDGRPITVTRLDATTCRATFDRPYTINETFNLSIPYSGTAVSAFFGSISIGTRSSGAPYCYTLSEPWYAYTWWPNKDDNFDKSTFDMHITTSNTLKAVCNGVLQGTDALPNNQVRYRWRTDYAMVPYLASIGLTNYNTWTRTYSYPGGTMPVQFWILPESDTTANRNAWELCLPMLSTFRPLFGEYPFINEKYGIYQFNFSGGMEHQTATGMGGFWESVNAHELAHQWWGDMITCGTWHDIWLNEGFATYSEALWSERKAGGTFAAYKNAMQSRRPSATSGTVYCYDISDPNRIFSGTYSYNKGAWAMHMLRGIVGETTFFNILNEFRNRFQYQSAITSDFIDVCEDVYGDDLNFYFDKFVYGGGVPVYQWAWQTVTSNNKNYLLVYTRQTQSSTFGTFTMPIDIRPTVGGVKQQKKIWNDALTENYVIPLSGAATACTFDEDVWILNGGVTATSFVHGGPTVVETIPSPNQKTLAAVKEIKITFHTGVTTSASDYVIRMNGSATPIPFSFSYDSVKNTVTLNPSRQLAGGTFSVEVKDTVRATNNNAQLDGEMSLTPTLPSGNGQSGGAMVFSFSTPNRK